MPNHVHTLTSIFPGWTLEKTLHSWKSFTAKKLNQRMDRSGEFWQEDYYNRLVRDKEHFSQVLRYIERNPAKANLGEDESTLYVSDGTQDYRSCP